MVYRLYVATVKKEDRIAWAFTFYNHQDFLVYKRFGVAEGAREEAVILEQSAVALAYFDSSMRRRYYDEHFSTRIDEDYVTLFTEVPDIERVADIIKSDDPYQSGFIGGGDVWHALIPFFKQKTMSFKTETNSQFINAAKELADKMF